VAAVGLDAWLDEGEGATHDWLSAALPGAYVSGVVYEDLVHGAGFSPGDRPLAGIPVSDGSQVVLTDARGRYRLPLRSDGALVRLSFPSGYWPVAGRWFRHVVPEHGAAGTAATCDFPLRADAQSSTWHMVQVTDIHYLTAAADNLDTFCRQVNALQPAPVFLMASGDLVVEANAISHEGSTREMFRKYAAAMAPLTAPVFSLPGNHDMAGVTGHLPSADPLYGLRAYEALVGPAWYSFNYGGVHVLALDASLITPGRVCYGFPAACLSWLRADLEVTPAHQPLLVFVHQPPADWGNPGELQALLAGRKVLGIFCGHTHKVADYTWESYPVHEGGALSGWWWLHKCPDGKPRGFRTLQVTPEAVTTEYVAADLPRAATLDLVGHGLSSRESLGVLERLITIRQP
jgi:hypothetical protein